MSDVTTDERGIARPQHGAYDIGALEATVGSTPTFGHSNVTVPVSSQPVNLAQLLNPSPTGGTFSGPGVSNGMFNPAGFATGAQTIAYTAPLVGTDLPGIAKVGINVGAASVLTSASVTVSLSTPSPLEGTPFTATVNISNMIDQYGDAYIPRSGSIILTAQTVGSQSITLTAQQLAQGTITVPFTVTYPLPESGISIDAAVSLDSYQADPFAYPTVSNVPPSNLKLSATTVYEGSVTDLTGSFVDPGGADDLETVDVNWNDGSADTVTTYVNGERSFDLQHTYAIQNNGPASYNAAVTVTDRFGGTTSANQIINVQRYTPSLVVTTAVDEDNGSSNPGLGSGTSLREAIEYANSLGGNPIITFAPGLAGQPITVSNGWNGSSDDTALRVNDNVTIAGGGNTTINLASPVKRRLFLGGTYTLTGLSITGGNLAGQGDGGAAWSNGSLTLQNDTFTGNQGDLGGAVWSGGTVSILNSTFTNNTGQSGGAIYSSNQLTITSSTFSGNTGSTDAGAIQSTGTVTLTNSTFNNNATPGNGGAIESFNSLTVTATTFSTNTANEGGAIMTWGGQSQLLVVSNSTIAGNSATSHGSAVSDGSVSSTFEFDTMTANIAAGSDGTLWFYNSTPMVQNTIVAGNSNDGVGTYQSGAFAAGSTNNVLGTGDWAGLNNGVNANKIGITNPGLSALGNFGGPTQTIALINTSPAIGAAVAVSGIVTDQRGIARGIATDVGAYQSAASLYLQLDADGVHTDLWTTPYPAGTYAMQFTAGQINGLTLVAAGGAGSVTIDESKGLIPSVTVTGDSSTALSLIGTNSNDSVTAAASHLNINGSTISFSGMSSVNYNPGPGTNSLNVTGGTLNLSAAAAGAGITSRLFSSIQITAGSTLRVTAPVSASDRAVVVTSALSISGNGQFDLSANDLIVHNGNLQQLQSQLTSGQIISSAAAVDSTHLTTLGVLLNNNGSGNPIYGTGTVAGPFDGQNAATADVLIKYTYVGDANLDGKVDGSDYTRIDSAYLNHLTGWSNGDFNLDGVVDGSDYTLIDNAFNTQGTSLSPTVVVNLVTGFSDAGSSITTNGNASINGNNLQLTANSSNQVSSAYYTSKLNVSHFTSDFTFNQNAGAGDGFTFTIQNSSINALGDGGGSLGYGNINNSLAIKFDLYDNSGEGSDSTGMYLNGATPTTAGSVDLSSTGINLHGRDAFRAAISYAGSSLNVTLTDLTSGAAAEQTYTLNIASTIGSNTAWFGFTAATGGATALQQINSWAVYG